MYRRHLDVPPFEIRRTSIPAQRFNRTQRLLTQHRDRLRLPLPELRSLQLILQKDAWITVDLALNEIPVLAWMDFASTRRDNLHQPVACELRLFHASAGALLRQLMTILDRTLDASLPTPDPADSRVIPFDRDL